MQILDKSSDNFEGSRYIVSVPRLHCKVQQKIKTEHCFCLHLTMQNGLIQWNFAKFSRILGLVACAFRVGRTIRDDKEMTYWILRLHWGVWKETGEWWLCRFAVLTHMPYAKAMFLGDSLGCLFHRAVEMLVDRAGEQLQLNGTTITDPNTGRLGVFNESVGMWRTEHLRQGIVCVANQVLKHYL